MFDFEALKQAVVEGNAARARELTQVALEEGKAPRDILDSALIPAMDVVGEKFTAREFFIPEMLVAARAMQAGLGIIRPLLASSRATAMGRVVIGTVEGDLHDIGKNLVGIMLQGAGFEVIDLGTDVKPARFVQAAQESRADFVMMSALLTTTMASMRKTIEALEAAGIRDHLKVAVGGAPVTQRYADEIGADFYAPDAAGAASKAREMLTAGG